MRGIAATLERATEAFLLARFFLSFIIAKRLAIAAAVGGINIMKYNLAARTGVVDFLLARLQSLVILNSHWVI